MANYIKTVKTFTKFLYKIDEKKVFFGEYNGMYQASSGHKQGGS